MGRLEFHGRYWFTCKIVSQRYEYCSNNYLTLMSCRTTNEQYIERNQTL